MSIGLTLSARRMAEEVMSIIGHTLEEGVDVRKNADKNAWKSLQKSNSRWFRPARVMIALLSGVVLTSSYSEAENLCDIGYTRETPVRFELPDRPSSRMLQNEATSWKIGLTPDGGEDLRVAGMPNLAVGESEGRWYVSCGIPCSKIPANKIFQFSFSDGSGIFEPCTSSGKLSTNDLRDWRRNCVVLFFLRFTRSTALTVANEGLTATFCIDDSCTTARSCRIQADPTKSESSQRVRVSANGYQPICFEIMIDRIGEVSEIPLFLHTTKENLDFEKAAYLCRNGMYKRAREMLEKLSKSASGRWGFLEFYLCLANYHSGERDLALSNVTTAIADRARPDKDFLLESCLLLAKSQMLFDQKNYREAQRAAADGLIALNNEEGLYGVSRMKPPYSFLGSWELRGELKFFETAASSELYLASRKANDKDKAQLLDNWVEVRGLTEKILADDKGKELLKTNPYEERIQRYESAIEKL